MRERDEPAPSTLGTPLEEYKEASANIRHYSTVRAAQLTIFVTITSGLLVIFFTGEGATGGWARLVLPLMGSVVVLVFWILDFRVQDYFQAFKKRATELENGTTYSLYSGVPERGWLHGRTATWLLFGTVLVLWVVLLGVPVASGEGELPPSPEGWGSPRSLPATTMIRPSSSEHGHEAATIRSQ